MINMYFFKGKNVFITGCTGFKGTWMSKVLVDSGANVIGYALKPEEKSLFKRINLDKKIKYIDGDIRDFTSLKNAFDKTSPEIVIHMAAQPIVRIAYELPRVTYETNIMGTVNVLECVRNSSTVRSFLNVTTDKVYENLENKIAFKEEEKLNGYDPYSNSKSCSELVTSSYKNSFLNEKNIAVSTARAGNVIGGGDYSKFRIIPDCVRAGLAKEEIIIRNPNSVRPYQHVLDAIFAYLMIAKEQYENIKYSGCYNVGPDSEDIITTENIVKIFCKYWQDGLNYKIQSDNGPYESTYLQLDCAKIKSTFNWKPVWNIETAIQKVVELEKLPDFEKEKCMEKQIKEFYGK